MRVRGEGEIRVHAVCLPGLGPPHTATEEIGNPGALAGAPGATAESMRVLVTGYSGSVSSK